MVTVIIPVYNAEKTIIRTLDSVKNQTAREFISQIIIVDDGSSDGSKELILQFAVKHPTLPIQYIYQQNQGAAAARNKALQLALTKYVAFLDADDIWLPEKIQRQLEVIHDNPHIRFLGTAWEEKPLRIGFKTITQLYNGTIKDLCIKNFPVTPSVLMETAFRDEIGYFDDTRRYAEDINYFQKIAAKGNYYYLPEKLVEIDNGKEFFAQSGLSSHLKEMHQGTLTNIMELRKKGHISFGFWLGMRIFYQLKYCRRIMLRNIASKRAGL